MELESEMEYMFETIHKLSTVHTLTPKGRDPMPDEPPRHIR